MRGIKRLLIVLTIQAGIAACGGGGGSGGGDDTPPTVDSTSPSDGAAEIALDAPVTATFSEALDPATVHTGSFLLETESGTPVAAAVSYAEDTRTATLTPASWLRDATVYRATVTLGVRDLAGNPLAAKQEWSFTTAGQVFETVGVQVSAAGEVAQDPTLVLAGSTLTVGYRVDPGVIALNLWDGSSWGDPLPDPAAGQSLESVFRSVDLCAADAGVHLTFGLQGDPAATDGSSFERVFAYLWTSATDWLALNGGQEVSWPSASAEIGAGAEESAIACRAGRGPWVAWAEEPDGGPGGISALFVASVTESAATRSLPHNRVTHAEPVFDGAIRTLDVAANAAGNAIVAFWETSADGSGCELYVSEFDGATFSPLGDALAFDTYPQFASAPAVAVEGDTVYVAYTAQAEIAGERLLWVKKYAGGAWSTVGPTDVAGDASLPNGVANPDLLVVNGVPVLAWEETAQVTDSTQYNEGIFVAHFDAAAGRWVVDGRQIEVAAGDPAYDPSLAYAEATGLLYVAFEEIYGDTTGIFVRRTAISF